MGKFTPKKSLKRYTANVLNFLLLFSLIVPYGFFPKDVFAYTFPSTNELNKNTEVRPYVEAIETGIGYVKFNFVNNHTNSLAYFEYKIDGNEKTSGTVHPVTGDFIYPGVSVDTRGTSTTKTVERVLNAQDSIEIRLALGGERDWDFDWTKFEVPSKPDKVEGLAIFKGHNSDSINNLGCNAYTNNTQIRVQWNASSDPDLDYYWFGTKNNPKHKKVSATQNWYDGNMTPGNNPYYYTVIAVNKDGYESDISDPCNLILDTEKPSTPEVLGFKNPTNSCGAYTNIKTTTVDWTDSDGTGSTIKGYEYQINYPNTNGTRGLWTPFFNFANSQYTGSLNEGRHYVRVRAQDMAGNWSDWSQEWANPSSLTETEKNQNCSIEYDSIVPTIPTNLYFWDVDNNKAIQCGGFSNTRHINEHWDTASDINFSHYEYSSFNAPNGSVGLIKSVFYTNYFNSSWWNIPTEGTYGFQVRTLDLAGNISPWAFNDIVGVADSCKITIDWTAPVVEITNPSDSQYVKGTVDFRGTVQDTNLLRYYYKIQNTTSATITTDTNILDQTIYTWDTTAKSDGEYELRLEARDKADNKDNNLSVDIINVIVDNTSPTIESLADFSINEGSTIPTKEVLVEDNYEIDQFCFSITSDIGDVSETCISPSTSTNSRNIDLTDTILTELSNTYGITTTTADTSLIPEGDYSISYFAKDKAGNESTPHTFIVTIENVLPTVLFSSSTTEILEGNSISFNGSFTDPGLDDSDWTYTLSFGDGTADVLGTLTTEGNILSNYSHTYTNAGDYTASLEVCEDGGLICTTDTIDITVGEVQGVTTGSNTTTTNSPTLAKKVTTYIANILGVGGEGDALALEEEENLENDEEVKGSQTCDNPSTISGYIYTDSNENGEKDEKERVFPEISIRVYTITEGMEETVKQIVSDENGYWETTLCIGDYYISIDDSKLPNNYVLGENDQQISVEQEKDSTLNFEVLDERNFLQKYWPWILLALGVLGSIGIVVLDTRRKKEYI